MTRTSIFTIKTLIPIDNTTPFWYNVGVLWIGVARWLLEWLAGKLVGCYDVMML